VMTKIGEAFLYSKAAFMAPADQPLLPMSKVVKGASGTCALQPLVLGHAQEELFKPK